MVKHTKPIKNSEPKTDDTAKYEKPTVLFKPLYPDVKVPVRAYGSAAFDLYVHNLSESGRPNKVVVPAHSTSRPIPCGFAFTPPSGFVGLVCSRSGLAQQGLFVANAPGVIDPDYTGEVKVLLYNGNHESKFVHHGDRIAQLLFVPFILPEIEKVTSLPESLRGEAGFGSTGLGEKE
jgi:dUTP pyrophosphatase